MEISLFYFSGTGNTWYIANEIAKHLSDLQNSVKLLPIEAEKFNHADYVKDIIESSEIVGFGFPIHNSDIAEIMKEFLESLPTDLSHPVRVFSFCTQMFFGGNAGALVKDFLDKKNSKEELYKLDWAAHFIMPCNLHLPPIVKIPTKPKIEKIVESEQKYISKFASKIAKGTPWIESGFNMWRSMFSLKFPVEKKLLAINTDKCNECNLCVEICPMDNIAPEKGNYHVKGNCYFCTRCYNFCPKHAFSIILEKTEPQSENNFKAYRGPKSKFDPKMLIQQIDRQ